MSEAASTLLDVLIEGSLDAIEAHLGTKIAFDVDDAAFIDAAVLRGNADVVRQLLACGAYPGDYCDKAVRFAVFSGKSERYEVLHALIRAGSRVPLEDEAFIAEIVSFGDPRALEILVAEGLSIDHPAIKKATAEHAAAQAFVERRQLERVVTTVTNDLQGRASNCRRIVHE